MTTNAAKNTSSHILENVILAEPFTPYSPQCSLCIWSHTEKENLFDNWELLKLVIISCIPMTFTFDLSWLFFLFWSCVTDNLVLKLWASVPVTYLVKIRIGDVFWESRDFELCFPSDLRFHFVRIKPLIQKTKASYWCLWKRKFGSHRFKGDTVRRS